MIRSALELRPLVAALALYAQNNEPMILSDRLAAAHQ